MKDYCTQNAGDCGSCSLVCYNLDCAGNPVDDALEQDELENLMRNDTRCRCPNTGLGE
jgi:hypothetical protein